MPHDIPLPDWPLDPYTVETTDLEQWNIDGSAWASFAYASGAAADPQGDPARRHEFWAVVAH